MKYKKGILLLLCTILIFSQLPAKKSKRKKRKIKDLPPIYQKWIRQDAAYIITDNERKVFLQLDSDKKREMFIQSFWKQRDPNPNTPENEFKIEHERRFKFANETLGRGTPSPGWRTDMGRIYIILGEPHQIQRYENMTETYPIINWFYQGLVQHGLPAGFNVLFFKEDGSGDYKLYSPVIHGPMKLLIHYTGDTNDFLLAYNELNRINPQLAPLSLSLVEGEANPNLRPSLKSDILLQQQIPSAPTKKINDSYATKLLKYSELISIDYSVNYVPNSAMVRVIQGPNGHFYVHYLIEPKKLSLEQYDDKVYANLEINGSIYDTNEKTIYEFNKSVPIQLRSDQLQTIQGKLFSFQDFFPLIEGTYDINILVRNVVSKEFTSIEKRVTIPRLDKPRVSNITLAHRARKSDKYTGIYKAFLVKDTQLLPSPRNDFVSGDNLYAHFQLLGLPEEVAKTGQIKYTLYKNDKEFKTLSRNLGELADVRNILQEFSLEGYSAAYYTLRVSLYDSGNNFLTMGEQQFYITPQRQLSRPWVVSMSSPLNSPDNLNKLGIQYSNTDNSEKAQEYMEQAYNTNPLAPHLALDFCRVLYKAKKYRKVVTVGTPFMQTKEKTKFYALLGFAHEALKEYEAAINYFKDYLTYHGTNIKILNSIGSCYNKLNFNEEALIAWEKSLELLPEQPELKAKVEDLKKAGIKTPKK